MKRPTQRETNPFPYSDSNKRYRTYDYFLREKFGCKVAKIPLAGNFTCPNIDGKKGHGGCIYCASGSGKFNAPASLPVEEQYSIMLESMRKKWNVTKTIPYFQAHTNTYAPTSVLEPMFRKAISLPGAVGLAIATRADCISNRCADMLSEVGKETFLTVELGLQTANDGTAKLINRCHSYEDFLRGYSLLKSRDNINTCVHLILGLPGESREDMMCTVKEVAKLKPDQVKFHLLYILKDTVLGDMYLRGDYKPLSREEYVSVLAEALTYLPKETVIGRVTGDAPAADLLAPEWSRKKLTVIDELDKLLYDTSKYQGIAYSGK